MLPQLTTLSRACEINEITRLSGHISNKQLRASNIGTIGSANAFLCRGVIAPTLFFSHVRGNGVFVCLYWLLRSPYGRSFPEEFSTPCRVRTVLLFP